MFNTRLNDSRRTNAQTNKEKRRIRDMIVVVNKLYFLIYSSLTSEAGLLAKLMAGNYL